MDKDENRSLFHVSFDKEQALHLLRKLLTYGVYVGGLCEGPNLLACIRHLDALHLNV